jgi:predicted O-methyltransferase YrrM
MEIVINKKTYPDNGFFKPVFHEEYFNLKIYPSINELEKEAGLMSDFAEACVDEGLLPIHNIYGNEKSENIMFLKDNLLNFKVSGNIVIGYLESNLPKLVNADVLLAHEHHQFDNIFYKKIKIEGMSKVLYLNQFAETIFKKYFWYYFQDNRFVYDNLICYTMIIKNGGPLLEQVLTENLESFDRWCILDTGSTDGTQEVIKRVLKNKKGKLYEEPFVNFKVSRNRCLELAGKTCKFTLMLDDTYAMRGNLKHFLNIVRGDQFSDTFSLMIQSDDTEYYSNRLVKTQTELRYIHTIHEVITNKNNVNVTVPIDQAFIYDHRAQYMEDRTNNRKQFDLQLLFKEVEDDPDDPRALYYIAQTYGCIGDEINKAKYFELRINHPVQGYVQEKIDACFELARCYNFKVNCETKELLENEHVKLSPSQWKRCEDLYLQAHNLDTNRPDGLYFIGIHYYLEGNHQLAYNFFKKGFEVGYPLGSQYSLKPTLSYHFLPKFLTEVSYTVGDYDTGLKAAQLFLTSPKYNKPDGESWYLMLNWHNIHLNLVKMGEIAASPKKNTNKIFCIVTDGGWEPWSGKDILTKGLGGSETWIVETARYIKNTTNFDVCVFCKTNEPEFFEGVGYNPVELFPNFIANNLVDYLIVSRFTEYVPAAIKGHAQNIGIIFHDLLTPETVIPQHYKLRWIFGLTDWHKNYIQNSFPIFKNKVYTTNYGIDQEKFHKTVKVKNSFIYSSFPNRGLVVLLKMWPRIVEAFPDATLNLYCNLEQEWVNKVAPDDMREIKALMKVNKKGVKNHGWVSKQTLADAWAKTEYWLYPCKFEETFCLTAMEAAITKTFAVTNNLAALGETVGNRGLIVHGNPMIQEWQDLVISELKKYMSGENSKEELLELNYNWAKERSWKSQSIKFFEMLTGTFEPMLNWTNDIPAGTRINFEYALSLIPKKSEILEIGVYSGTSVVEILKLLPEARLTAIDQWEDYYEYDNLINKQTNVFRASQVEKEFYNNTAPFNNRINVMKGKSSDKLIELLMKHASFNFIYVDGSHKCLDVYFDAVIAWKLLKIGGILAFDDYRFNKGDIFNSPFEAIEHFMELYKKDLVVIRVDYRVFLKKIN